MRHTPSRTVGPLAPTCCANICTAPCMPRTASRIEAGACVGVPTVLTLMGAAVVSQPVGGVASTPRGAGDSGTAMAILGGARLQAGLVTPPAGAGRSGLACTGRRSVTTRGAKCGDKPAHRQWCTARTGVAGVLQEAPPWTDDAKLWRTTSRPAARTRRLLSACRVSHRQRQARLSTCDFGAPLTGMSKCVGRPSHTLQPAPDGELAREPCTRQALTASSAGGRSRVLHAAISAFAISCQLVRETSTFVAVRTCSHMVLKGFSVLRSARSACGVAIWLASARGERRPPSAACTGGHTCLRVVPRLVPTRTPPLVR